MSRFHTCLDIVLGHEGGYSNHPFDRGGATNYGITQKTYDMWRREHHLSQRPVAEIEEQEVGVIYGEYWADARCSYMPEPLDLLMFDAAVNHGAGRAIRLLQRALGAEVDGVIGRKTMNALHEDVVAYGIEDVCRRCLDERAGFYDMIIRNDTSQSRFANGWMNRVEHLRELVEAA